MVNKDDDKIKLVKELAPNIETIRKYERIHESIIKQYDDMLHVTTENYSPILDDYLRILIQCQLLNTQMSLENMRNGFSLQLEHELDKSIRETQIKDQMRDMMKGLGIDDDTFKRFGKGFGSDKGT